MKHRQYFSYDKHACTFGPESMKIYVQSGVLLSNSLYLLDKPEFIENNENRNHGQIYKANKSK